MRKRAVIIGALTLFSAINPVFAAVPKKLNAFPEGDRLIYSRLVDAYRRNQFEHVIQQRQLLEKNYPSSIHLDNAYYLSGMMQFQNGRYGEAIRDFNTVTDRFPRSNKRPGALFAMAVTYDRLGLKPQAARVLESLIKEYPGSQESQRAWMQMKLLKQASSK